MSKKKIYSKKNMILKSLKKLELKKMFNTLYTWYCYCTDTYVDFLKDDKLINNHH